MDTEQLTDVTIFDCGFNPSTVPLLQRSWGRALASQGSADHEEYVGQFVQDVDDVIDRTDDLPQELLGACGTAEIALLAMEAGALEAFVLVDGVEEELYADVAEAGNVWLDAIPETDVEPFPTQ
ncbi:hypothetical protein [Serinicoccus kebangsaanensis]|uniref:hypothetical protein n=1 Tax=Serinicoccus kebangsaanensis TaxID=2602069 RepID=UPI00124C414F|nr:hypothetical protein [Serinicoccus kebangsaanensis]